MMEKYERVCQRCDNNFSFNPHYGKNYPAKYCSRACYFAARKGVRVSPKTEMKKGYKKEKAISWKGGKTTTRFGYIQIYRPDHPFSNQRGYIFEHRYVMEQFLGRYLDKKEVVHHIDHDKQNNNIDNLMLFPNHSDHMRYEIQNGDRKQTKKGWVIVI